jgi:hypothetical protein
VQLPASQPDDSQRRRFFNSPFVVAHALILAAAMGLLAIAPKYIVRKARLDTQHEARQEIWRKRLQSAPAAPSPARVQPTPSAGREATADAADGYVIAAAAAGGLLLVGILAWRFAARSKVAAAGTSAPTDSPVDARPNLLPPV